MPLQMRLPKFGFASTTAHRKTEIRTASLLILDDLGAHSSTPWAQEKLFQIFNHRYNARLPTVITATTPSRGTETATTADCNGRKPPT